MFGDGAGGFFFFSLLATIVPVLLVVIALAFFFRPKIPDRHGRRPYAVYLFAVLFVSVLTLLGAVGVLGTALAQSLTDTPRLGGAGCELRSVPGARSQSNVVPLSQQEPEDPERPDRPTFTIPPPDFEQPPPPPRIVRPSVEPFDPPVFVPPDFSEEERRRPLIRESFCEPASAAPAALQALFIAFAAGGVVIFHAWRATDLLEKEASDD